MPLHPPLVHFPIALLVLSVVADWIAYLLNRPSLAATGWWAMAGATMGGLMAVATGLIDSHRGSIGPSVEALVNRHMYVGIAMLITLTVMTVWRWSIFASKRSMDWIYLTAGTLALGLMFYQGWLGGELVYTYGVS